MFVGARPLGVLRVFHLQINLSYTMQSASKHQHTLDWYPLNPSICCLVYKNSILFQSLLSVLKKAYVTNALAGKDFSVVCASLFTS